MLPLYGGPELNSKEATQNLASTGTMRTAPTAATEVLLGLPPLHLHAETEAKIGNYRLCCDE
jgi:hypothetical protein